MTIFNLISSTQNEISTQQESYWSKWANGSMIIETVCIENGFCNSSAVIMTIFLLYYLNIAELFTLIWFAAHQINTKWVILLVWYNRR